VKLRLLGAEILRSGFDGFQVGKVQLQEQSLFAGLLLQLVNGFMSSVGGSGGDVDFRIVR
jgi:hypothetical protein